MYTLEYCPQTLALVFIDTSMYVHRFEYCSYALVFTDTSIHMYKFEYCSQTCICIYRHSIYVYNFEYCSQTCIDLIDSSIVVHWLMLADVCVFTDTLCVYLKVGVLVFIDLIIDIYLLYSVPDSRNLLLILFSLNYLLHLIFSFVHLDLLKFIQI